MTIARILIVDDDPDFCEISRTILEPAGYEVITAADSLEAMERIESDWPDLILLDLVLNRVDEGLEFGERLHHDPILRHLPIVFVTSIADTRYAERIKAEDVHYAAAWLPKPFSPQTLIQTVGSVLEQRK
ncbi:MAG: putative response regulator [Anaerolineae bacterium]|jgi:CheY-like chemotaxis protein|nr:MAG: putative response regulator [Anaerolineae bacterium]